MTRERKAATAALAAVSVCHFLNDTLQAVLPLAEEWVRVRTGRDLLGEALASVPGVGPLLDGRRAPAQA